MIRRIIKIFQKIDEGGQIISEKREAVGLDENMTLNKGTQQIMYRCPSCQRPLEERNYSLSCPLCCSELFNEPGCCSWCHEERKKLLAFTLDKFILLERERRSWLESPLFNNVPFVKLYKKIEGFNSIRRLDDVRKTLLKG